MVVSPADVATFRAFNRSWTSTAGLLRSGLLDTPFSLTEARILFELAQGDGLAVADLRRALDLDSGYLSRIVGRLRGLGLVVTERSPSDGRQQVARLTAAGRAAFADLDERSAAQVEALLSPLPAVTRTSAVDAMATLTDAFGARRGAPEVRLRPPEAGDLGWIVERHGALYADERDWDRRFEALVARVVADYVDDHDPARDAVWIAEVDGRRAGSIMCVHAPDDPATSRLRLMLVEPWARGHGVGGRLVDACVALARTSGADRLTLWTVHVLEPAIRLYRAAGFVLVDEEPGPDFEPGLISQTYDLDLR